MLLETVLAAMLSVTTLNGCSSFSYRQLLGLNACTQTYSKRYEPAHNAVLYEYDEVGAGFHKEVTCLTGFTAETIVGPGALIAFHSKQNESLMVFKFDFLNDQFILETLTYVPDISETHYVMEVMYYVSAIRSVQNMQMGHAVPNHPVLGFRGLLPKRKAEAYLNYLKGNEGS